MPTIKPIEIGRGFDPTEVYNDGYDVSVVTPSGDTVNVFIDSDGVTHVTLQGEAKPDLYTN